MNISRDYDPTQPDLMATSYCLNEREARVLVPVVTRALKEANKNMERLQGVQESGDFGDKQSNALYRWEERVGVLEDFLRMTGYFHANPRKPERQ